MNKMFRTCRRCVIGMLLPLWLAGCATTGEYVEPDDPWEGFNRAMYSFNDGWDRAVLKPVARGYKAIMPAPLNRGVTNFFSNLSEVNSILNNLLQLKLQRAGNSIGRLAVNSTVGVLGFVDVASTIDIPRYREDFGQTFGVWGVPTGPYLVLPFLGPSSGRDAVGLLLDWQMAPVNWATDSAAVRYGLLGLWFVDQRADLLGVTRILEQAALDPYAFTREAYLQKRLNDVYDGNPPLDEFEEELEREYRE